MALKLIEGFETSRVDTDLRIRGYLQVSGVYGASVPSQTQVGGYGFAQISASISNTSNSMFDGASSVLGIWPSTTVNQAWASGGFALGFSATANCALLTGKTYGTVMNAATSSNVATACYDGVRYWTVAPGNTLYRSADLRTWTQVTLPTGSTMTALGTVSSLGGGTVVLQTGTTKANGGASSYVSTDGGITWTTYTGMASALTGTFGISSNWVLTGNSAAPHLAAVADVSGSSTTIRLMAGTVSGTMQTLSGAQQAIASGTANTLAMSYPKICGNIAVMVFTDPNISVCYIMSGNATSSTILTDTWTTASMTYSGYITGIDYCPTSNLYVMASNTGGIYTITNAGAVGTPAAITATQTASVTRRYSTANITGVRWDAATQLMVGWGYSGHIITSPDGITWTEVTRGPLPSAGSLGQYSMGYYDGSKMVIHTDSTTGLVCTSSNGANNWQVQYCTHKGTQTNAAGSPNIAGYITTSATSPPTNPTTTTGMPHINGATMFGFNIQQVTAAGVLTVSGLKNVPGTSSSTLFTSTLATVTDPKSATHFYEIVAKQNTATTNTFDISMYIDGVLQGTLQSAVALAATTDTTTNLAFCPLNATQQIAQVDDLYFQVGATTTYPLAAMNIVARQPTSDVSIQWTRNGTEASNALAVNENAVSSNTASGVTSANTGDADVYASNFVTPTGYKPIAVQMEVAAYKGNAATTGVKMGIVTSGTEADSPELIVTSQSAATPVVATQVFSTDASGNAWTKTSLESSQMKLIHST